MCGDIFSQHNNKQRNRVFAVAVFGRLKKRSFYDFSLFIFLWLRLGFEKDLFFILRIMFSCVFAVQKHNVVKYNGPS
jgi:hypothetical protein